MTHEQLVVPIEWKAAAGEENVLEGYASTFGNVDLGLDVVERGAFRKTVRERVPAGQVKLLLDHMPTAAAVLGTVVEAKEDARGLYIKAKLSSAPDAQAVRTKLLEGHLDRMSIGYRPVRWSYKADEDGRQVRHLEEVMLGEVSVVAFPMNPEAAVRRVKSFAQSGAASVEEARELLQKALAALDEPPAPPQAEEDAAAPEALDASPDPGPADEAKADPTDDTAPDAAAASDEERARALRLKLHRADNVLAGRDPDEVADSATLARITTRLELLGSWVDSTRGDE